MCQHKVCNDLFGEGYCAIEDPWCQVKNCENHAVGTVKVADKYYRDMCWIKWVCADHKKVGQDFNPIENTNHFEEKQRFLDAEIERNTVSETKIVS